MLMTSVRVVEALSHLERHAEPHAPEHKAARLSIAVTRQAGSRGAEIAVVVGRRLGWPVYDHELIRVIAEMKGVQGQRLARFDERCSNWVDDMIDGLSPLPTLSGGRTMKLLIEEITSLGKTGHCVIVGRGAVRVLDPVSTLRVRIVAPRSLRVLHVRDRMHISHVEAERWVDQTDATRAAFLNSHFNMRPDDPELHDMLVNSGRMSTEECADLIVDAAKIREARH